MVLVLTDTHTIILHPGIERMLEVLKLTAETLAERKNVTTIADIKDFVPEQNTITMFTTDWCSYCKRLKLMLASTDIALNEVNIETTPGTEELVKSLNDGNAVVPTVIFPDGSTATNPSITEVKTRISA